MHVIPPNGFPNVPSFAELDAIAKQIENLPTFTSNDRAFLEELPAFPSEEGVRVLTATTEEGETSLSYDEVENELPINPSEDGVRVLTATTEDGETVKSWEMIQSGENRAYSTTPQDIGVWTNGKKVKRVVINLNGSTTFKNNDWVHIPLSGNDYSVVINACAIGPDGAYCPLVVGRDSINTSVLACRVDSTFVGTVVIVEYVESEV